MLPERLYCQHINLDELPSPCFVVDKTAVERNLKIISEVQKRSGAKILGALKAFSLWHLAPLYTDYLQGVCASGINEARLGADYYPGEIHTYSPGFKSQELNDVLAISNHVIFNSFSQWERFKQQAVSAHKQRPLLKFGLRINPQHSEGTVDLYDPCAIGSRLGILAEQFIDQDLELISGLHFHTLCEQGVEPLERTLKVVEQKFGHIIKKLEWINFGGGHHITAPSYDTDKLIHLIQNFSQKYQVQVYLEPGEAIAINTGILISEVVDIIENNGYIAILDTSATCHMPDTLEMPYRPEISGADLPNKKPYTYKLGGMTCLAGDSLNEYSFDHPLKVGQRLVFEDMSHYTMVKTTTFNGINLPSIAIFDEKQQTSQLIKTFDYSDFKDRLS